MVTCFGSFLYLINICLEALSSTIRLALFQININPYVPPYTAEQVDKHSGYEAPLKTGLEPRRGSAPGVSWLFRHYLDIVSR